MSNKYNFIIFISLLLGLHYISPAQTLNCDQLYDLDITTNPDDPVNERHPDFEQQYFDWRTLWYDINWSANTNNQEYSPFYQPDNAIVDHLKDGNDFKPEDGWELINYNLGFDLSGSPIPNPRESIYLVLYNRYHAKLRVFVLLGEQQEGYSNCRISVRHLKGSNQQYSGVLEGARQYTAPLMEFDGTKKISSTSRHLNNSSSWSYAEFHLTYDPCACLHTNSRLVIEQKLVDVAAITLEGTSSGTLEMLDENNPNNNPDGAKNGYYQEFSGFFEDVDGAVSAGKKSFNTYEQWSTALDTAADGDATSGVSNLLTALSSGDNALGKGLKTIPYVSEAIGIIDFFVGGGESEPETFQMAPMAMELNHRFAGSIDTEHPYNNIIFDLPGSSHQPYDGNPANWDQDFDYPHYNKPLGVISILERPKITTAATYNAVLDQSASRIGGYHWSGASRYSRRWFQYHGDLEYVVNPEAGLEVEEVHAAVVTHLSNTTVDPKDSQHGHPLPDDSYPPYLSALSNLATQGEFSGGYKKVQDEVYSSELLPLSCLHNLTLYTHKVYQKWFWNGDDVVTSGHDPTLMNYPSYGGVFLKVVFNMKRVDGNGNNVLLVYQVPMEITDNGNLPEADMGWSTGFADVLAGLSRDTLIENETVNDNLYA